MGILDDLDQAEVFEKSKWFQTGRYIVDIRVCKFIQDGHKGDSFVVETAVVGAISSVSDAPDPGEIAAHVWSASGDKRDMAKATWIAFLCGVLGVEQKAYTGDQWKAISVNALDHNKLSGTRSYLECFMTKTRAGGDFTVHKWGGTPTAEQLAEFGIGAA